MDDSMTRTVDGLRAVAIEGRAGTAIFLHGITPHASAPAGLSGRRRVCAVRNARDDDSNLSGRTEIFMSYSTDSVSSFPSFFLAGVAGERPTVFRSKTADDDE